MVEVQLVYPDVHYLLYTPFVIDWIPVQVDHPCWCRYLDTLEVEKLGHLCSVSLALRVLSVSYVCAAATLTIFPPPPINLVYNPTNMLLL